MSFCLCNFLDIAIVSQLIDHCFSAVISLQGKSSSFYLFNIILNGFVQASGF